MIDSFHSSGSSSLFRIEVISLWISERIVLLCALIRSAGIWQVPGDLCLVMFWTDTSTAKAMGSGTSGSAVCVTVCLTSLISWNPCIISCSLKVPVECLNLDLNRIHEGSQHKNTYVVFTSPMYIRVCRLLRIWLLFLMVVWVWNWWECRSSDKYVKTKYLGKFCLEVGRGKRERNCSTSAGIVGTETYMYGYDGFGMWLESERQEMLKTCRIFSWRKMHYEN